MDYLKQLCEELNLDPHLRNENGRFYLPFPSATVEVKPLEPGVYFHSPIRSCPNVKKEELFIQLMKANLFGQGTMGSTIALNGNDNLLTLSRGMAYDMDYRAFRGALEDFINIVEYWREEIDRHVKQAEDRIL
ncbi:MAG: type III secretion system chaperone [Verrucomicrobia bacterium]|nr:type III secretion system chaperone [Verrucomicrobiota bacterium]